ncbi:UDP-glucose/GDP-mannose dehydrogenase family protein [Polyangium sp. y55x31]|uniref:UDP-glucose dehydrogenase family protein n=1 Tax=Polyangium sp. y55x31 TaxID=3042688 RepID=UPI002482EC34|nr:UDP-glucose/GDP-mannose dehydrogenase family protein [Polyangium sp. y55x31]MDI1482690.1 UDP-glucose/GDP-mannose dehydrogenase family protein [Polyangium sp. y55x31]
MRLAVIGTGYVGLVAGAGFSDFGNDVTCVDIDAEKITRLSRGEVPIYEPGLDVLIAQNAKAGRLTFSTDLAAAIRSAEVVIIAVGTPPAADGSADLSAVFAVAETIGKNMNGFKVVVTKSTVPVGTADKIEAILRRFTDEPFGVASNPEFLKEGAAIQDFMKPDRVVIGSNDARALAVLRNLYAPFVRTSDRIHAMDARSAELTKYASNAMLATRISFMNDLAVLSEKIGADIELVRKAVGADPRIGPKFLFPGPGFGGSCFPKDISALIHIGASLGHELEVVRAVERVNARQKKLLFEKIRRHFDGALEGRTVAVWGLAFKPQTDDIREAPALVLIEELLAAGATVRAHDPAAMENVRAVLGDRITYCESMYDAALGADALALVTEWHEFRRPDFSRIKRVMRNAALFDGRNVWDADELRALGFWYTGIGRG